MLLRGSREQAGMDVELGVVTGQVSGDGGVPDGDLLIPLAEALPRRDWDGVAHWRDAIAERLGSQQAIDAIAVASMFNGITRVADATGIPLDDSTEGLTGELRASTGIDTFAPAEKWDSATS